MPSSLSQPLRKLLSPNLLAALLGLGLVVVLEAALQLLDVGPSNRLFEESIQDGEAVYAVNPQVAHRFFTPQYRRQFSSESSFSQKKPPDTVRIFALGASTLLGFPNPLNTSFPHFLGRMLEDVYPAKRFQVLNCGITGINTFCLLDFTHEIVEYEPDLILLYSGHNEYLGPYGVTTPFNRLGNNRTWIRFYMYLQRSKIYYCLRELPYRLQQWWRPPSAEEHFGLHLFDHEIGALDEGHRTTRENYRQNLEEMLQSAHQHRVPVLLSTLVSNLQFYPFRSECDVAGLSRKLVALDRQGRLLEAVAVCEEALNQAPHCANIHFELGRLHYRGKEYEKAHQAFVRARDLDRLPFRAPTAFNQIIRDLAGRARGPVLLSDAAGTVAAASLHGIVGNELITEYLHPTVYGHYLIARNMVADLAHSPVGASWGKADTSGIKTYEDYTRQLGYSLLDQVVHRTGLMLFLCKMPYKEPPLLLRRHVAALMHQQIGDIQHLETAQRQKFAQRQVMAALFGMLDFLPPGDRRTLAELLKNLDH